ncbi:MULTISPECIES: ATP-dependent DNA ligase [Streptomyces]|nr:MULTISPECIES: hypothetical protein [Streptomyces]
MTWIPPEPMLATLTPLPQLRAGWAAEPKWDGSRAVVSVGQGQVVLWSRRGTQMAVAFPEVIAGAGRSLGLWRYRVVHVGAAQRH